MIVVHLDTGTFIKILAVNFSYCVHIALICEKIYVIIDILDNRDNFVVNIEIQFLALSHTFNSKVHLHCFVCPHLPLVEIGFYVSSGLHGLLCSGSHWLSSL